MTGVAGSVVLVGHEAEEDRTRDELLCHVTPLHGLHAFKEAPLGPVLAHEAVTVVVGVPPHEKLVLQLAAKVRLAGSVAQETEVEAALDLARDT